ncbi:hypothetical protein K1T71_006584 [Dendrolimus kikuchii]|uniref:Uncharacterized protein n=1 Tax=Dendrolimus kikuchii TaxID=765133 RepID=A0ACC1D1J4_9NEOP|nr:hypothetical protein K1T71_006584 [Dendrolimus kikuchii]
MSRPRRSVRGGRSARRFLSSSIAGWSTKRFDETYQMLPSPTKSSYWLPPRSCACLPVLVAQICFKRFQSENFDIKDARRSGRPVTDKIEAIFEKVELDRHISSYDVAEELGIDHKPVLAHLKKAGYIKKLDIWVPHELTERNLMNRVLICDCLLRRNETEPFLKKLITGDEKWITYDKNVRKRSWSKAGQASQTVAIPGLTRNKVMLCVWWDWKGIIHYELLPPGRTIDFELYCEQLIRFKQKALFLTLHITHIRPQPNGLIHIELKFVGFKDAAHPSFCMEIHDLQSKPLQESLVPKHNFNKADYEQINKYIYSLNWQAMFSTDNIDQALDNFYDIIELCVDKYVPLSRKGFKRSYPPWYSRRYPLDSFHYMGRLPVCQPQLLINKKGRDSIR